MKTAHTRRSAVIGSVVGTILLALSMPVAQAGPGDGPGGSENPTLKPPKLHASENPVVFGSFQTVKWISVTAQPYTVTVHVIWKENGVQQGPGAVIYPGTTTNLAADITYGKTYTTRLETIPENGLPKEVGPWLTITTVRPEVATYNPKPPPEIKINPTLTARRPVPPAPSDQGAAGDAPAIDRNPRTAE